ncbi:MAG: hypothetical protein ABI134_07045, partial [Byssovorax sp.]
VQTGDLRDEPSPTVSKSFRFEGGNPSALPFVEKAHHTSKLLVVCTVWMILSALTERAWARD